MELSLDILRSARPRLFSGDLGRVQSVLCGSGYTGEPFAQEARETLGEEDTVQIAKRSELHKFAVIPKRWVVERSFAWLEKNRRLWKICELAQYQPAVCPSRFPGFAAQEIVNTF